MSFSHSHTTRTVTSTRSYGGESSVYSTGERSYSTSPQLESSAYDERRYSSTSGSPGAGFLSIRYTWDHVNLPYLHTYRTYTYQAADGHEAWYRTFHEDQEWLKKIATQGAPVIERKVPTEWDKPWIGAIVVTTDPRVVILKDCIRDGPADLAHLDDDDKIVGFGGATITDTNSFNQAFRDYAKVNTVVEVQYLQGGQGAPKTTQLKVLSQGHKNELLAKHRANGVSITTDRRR